MAKPFFGLDIGTSSIKIVQLVKEGSLIKLVALGSASTPVRGLSSESELDHRTIAEIILKLIQDSKVTTQYVVTALPESQVFTRVIEMPVLSEQEVASAIKWEAEQYIPLPLTEVTLDYQILSTPKDNTPESKMEVLLVAAPSLLIKKYTTVLEMANLIPLSLETEIISLSRSLVGTVSESLTTMLINIGAATTDIAIVRNGLIVFTRSVATGGIALTRAIASELNLDLTQAEEYKKSYGLDQSKLQGKIVSALKPIFDVIANEIKRALNFYITKWPNSPIKRVVLAGGSAKLPGLVQYFAENLGLEVQTGDPWISIAKDERLNKILTEEGPMYSAAVGLALKDLV